MYQNIEIIAEVKTKSPFGYQSSQTWDELFKIAESIGDMIAVHTDIRWGGSFELIREARKRTQKPILAKGIHTSDEDIIKAIKYGADWVLVVGRIPDIHLKQCMIEPINLKELFILPTNLRVVWNSRDIQNGNHKQESFTQARAIREGWLCQASFIKTVNDISLDANAVLVGTYLSSFAESLKNSD